MQNCRAEALFEFIAIRAAVLICLYEGRMRSDIPWRSSDLDVAHAKALSHDRSFYTKTE